jgi:hypothetical protein
MKVQGGFLDFLKVQGGPKDFWNLRNLEACG